MYSSEDFERLFIRYKSEAYPKGESIQTFCHRNNVPYNLFEKWYKDTRHKVVECPCPDVRPCWSRTSRKWRDSPGGKVRLRKFEYCWTCV